LINGLLGWVALIFLFSFRYSGLVFVVRAAEYAPEVSGNVFSADMLHVQRIVEDYSILNKYCHEMIGNLLSIMT